MLRPKDRRLLRELQEHFPLAARPYLEIARSLGLSEAEVLAKVRALRKKRVIRYIGGVFDTKKLGRVSTLIAMRVPKKKIKQVSSIINGFAQVSHNYLRDGSFNLWFTLSAGSKSELSRLIRRIKKLTGITRLLDLATRKVFKIDARFALGKR
jgi:DNA-binding Lrp family transcriptional regulator